MARERVRLVGEGCGRGDTLAVTVEGSPGVRMSAGSRCRARGAAACPGGRRGGAAPEGHRVRDTLPTSGHFPLAE